MKMLFDATEAGPNERTKNNIQKKIILAYKIKILSPCYAEI
jgi:hypothetical protein